MRKLIAQLAVFVVVIAASTAVAQPGYTIVAISDPSSGGTVEGAGGYPAGAGVTLIARPNLGYRFVGWIEDELTVATDPVLSFTADRDRELTARFEPTPVETGIGGRWDFKLRILPEFAFEGSRLEFSFSQSNGDLSGDLRLTSSFTSSGWTGFDARATARLGPVQGSAGAAFDPAAASYKSSYLITNFDLFGISLSLRANHYAVGGGTDGPYLLYTLSARSEGISITLHAEQTDCCLSFRDVLVNRSSCGLSICDGIPVQGAISFTRDEGFSYLQLTARGIADLPGGISLDAKLKFTTDSKELDVTPHWAGWGDANFRLYGNVEWDSGRLEGIDLYGFKIRCCFECGSCPGARISAPYMEFLTGFDPAHVPGGFQGDEFEYWKAGFCTPACCGDYYTVEMTAYFSHSSVSLFDLSRLKLGLSYPLFSGFTVDVDLELAVIGDPTLNVGWQWEF